MYEVFDLPQPQCSRIYLLRFISYIWYETRTILIWSHVHAYSYVHIASGNPVLPFPDIFYLATLKEGE